MTDQTVKMSGTELVFLPADPPRAVALRLLPGRAGDADAEVTVAVSTGKGTRRRVVPAATTPVGQLLDHLARRPIEPDGSSLDAWSAATRFALDLIARGRLQPGITAAGTDTWRAGPLAPDDARRLAELAAAFPPPAHALVIDCTSPVRIRRPEHLIAEYLDAVADTMVRTAAAPIIGGHPAYAATPDHDVTGLEAWLADVAAPITGTAARPALRFELPDGPDGSFVAVVQLTSAVDPSLMIDAADVWSAPAVVARFGDAADTDLLLALRRGGRAWPPLTRLLEEARPSALVRDTDVMDLLGDAGARLGAIGVDVLVPAELATQATAAGRDRHAPARCRHGGRLHAGVPGRVPVGRLVDGHDLTAEELAVLAEAKRPLVRVRGRWVMVDADLRGEAAAYAERARRRRPRRGNHRHRSRSRARWSRPRWSGRWRRWPSGSPRSSTRPNCPGAGGVGRNAAALPTAGGGVDGGTGAAGPRRLPGRRHGARQDRAGDRSAPAAPSAGRPLAIAGRPW